MRGFLSVALAAFALGQGPGSTYSGTWIAEFEGTTYVRLELNTVDGGLGGRISLGNIHVDSRGEVDHAEAAPSALTSLFDVSVRDSILSFSRKDGQDTDRFQLRLLTDETAELRFTISDTDLKELAAEGIPAPKPVRLKRIGPKGTKKAG
jgi:hypothetical protein